MRVIDKIRETGRLLGELGIEEPVREAEELIVHALGMDRVRIYRDNPPIGTDEKGLLEEVLRRRARREPLQYITGHVDFLGLRLMVGEGVLIPRPETEVMAEEAIKRIRDYRLQVMDRYPSLCILDLCTGSGCLALSLARAFPDAYVYGSDISWVATGYAVMNALANRVNNVGFITGDLFRPFRRQGHFDVIITNPPYIRTGDIGRLQPEIREWEPIVAIDGGRDGLEYYRRIIPEACHYLKDGGLLIMEINPDGLGWIVDKLKDSGYTGLEVLRDYSGMQRIVVARWRG
jgi:release factor glutamine methyltransferase